MRSSIEDIIILLSVYTAHRDVFYRWWKYNNTQGDNNKRFHRFEVKKNYSYIVYIISSVMDAMHARSTGRVII